MFSGQRVITGQATATVSAQNSKLGPVFWLFQLSLKSTVFSIESGGGYDRDATHVNPFLGVWGRNCGGLRHR